MSHDPVIYIVGQQRDILEQMKEQLAQAGYSKDKIHGIPNNRTLLHSNDNFRNAFGMPDLLIMATEPEERAYNGPDTCAFIRRHDWCVRNMPIVGIGQESDKYRWEQAGVSAFIEQGSLGKIPDYLVARVDEAFEELR
ncbi:hypothetical protein ACFL96_18070 [Thermoproteota archaeon]